MDAAAAGATENEKIAEKSGVCVQCIERCQREHHVQGAPDGIGRFSSAQTLHPCFLRTVLEHNLRNNMAIPKAFVKTHGRDLPGSTVDLEGVNGKVWLVTVVITSTGTAMLRFGWHVFAADNNLKSGDSLLFTMVAKNRFTVRVFTKGGVESTDAMSNTTSSAATFRHDSKWCIPTSTSPVGVHYNLDDQSDEFMGTESGNSGGSSDHVENGWGMDSAEEGVRGGHGPTIKEIIRTARACQSAGEPVMRRSKSRKPQHPKRHRTANGNREVSPPLDGPGWNSILFASLRRPVTLAEREQALAAAEAQRLVIKRPSVAVVMMPSHVYRGFWLNIPMEFARQHMPYGRVDITLRDISGYPWIAKWINEDRHSGLSGGWGTFSKDHRLEEGDVCVFEILDSNLNYTFRVHIFRVVDVPLIPGSVGGYDVTYNIIKPSQEESIPGSRQYSRPVMPDLNASLPNEFAVKPEPVTSPHPRKKNFLADVLQEMIRSGQFSKRQLEDQALSFKIRALAEDGTYDDEDVKPDIKAPTQILTDFKRRGLHSPINHSSDSIKAESEDFYSMTSTHSFHSLPAIVKVKTEPDYVVKTEDVSANGSGSASGSMAVYTRRRSKSRSINLDSRSAASDERIIWYSVIRVLDSRRREGKAEKEILVEILGTVPENERSSFKVVEHCRDGSWWVPMSHFFKDFSGCYFS